MVLDAPIADLLAPETVDALRAGGYRPDAITVRQLLVHTSGIYDYGTDPAYQAAVNADPAKRWTRLEQVRFADRPRHPRRRAGRRVRLLRHRLHLARRDPRTGHRRTPRRCLPHAARLRTPPPRRHLPRITRTGAARQRRPSPPVRGRHRRFRLPTRRSTSTAPPGWSPPSTTSPRFYRALLRGDVFTRPETLDTMLEIPPTNTESGAGMGIFRIDVAGNTCWSHSGFWGTFVADVPADRRDHRRLLEPGDARRRLRRRDGSPTRLRAGHRPVRPARRTAAHGASPTRALAPASEPYSAIGAPRPRTEQGQRTPPDVSGQWRVATFAGHRARRRIGAAYLQHTTRLMPT